MKDQSKTKAQLIQEMNEMRQHLAESAERFHFLLESPLEAICRFLPDTTLTFVNQKYCEFFGKSPEELIGQSFLNVVPEYDRDEARRHIESLVEHPQTQMVEHEQPRADGSSIWLQWINHPIVDADGHTIEFLSIGHEVTERKQAEMAEREQRSLAEALRDSADALNSTLHLDEVLDRILANLANVVPHDAAVIMLIESGIARIARSRGFSPEVSDGAWIAQLRYPLSEVPNLRYMIEARQALVIDDTHAYPGWIKRPQTEWQRAYAGAPIRIKGYVIGVVSTLSATVGFFNQTHAERLQTFADQAAIAIHNARLYEEADRLRAFNQNIVQSMDEGIVITDDSGRITFVNPKTATLLEYKAAALLQMHWDEIIEPDHTRESAIYPSRSDVAAVDDHYEAVLRTRSGKRVPALVSARTLNNGEQHDGMLIVFNDITRRKQAEEDLRRAHDELERRVAERTHDLERRTIQLQVAAKVARDATAAHELDELLDRAVNLVRDRFGYYYAGIYLIDERDTDALLHSATRPAGRQMLAQGFSVNHDDISPVAEVLRHGQPKIVQNIDAETASHNNALLPETRSELALPLKTHNGVLGALNVHSRHTAAFGDDDVAILQTMADQLAIAIEKMRLFQHVQATLEARLSTIVSHVPIILYAFDHEGVITVAEGKGLRAAGFELGEIVGQSVFDLFDNSPPVRDVVQRALIGEAFSASIKVNDMNWEVHFTPLYGSDGQLSSVIGVASDITERMRAEEALRLAQKTESLGVMAGGVAHDFNNLLVGVLGQTSLAQAKLAAKHPARINLDKAVHAAERAADLARQMLVYSGRSQFEIQPIDLKTLVSQNVPLIQASVPKNVRLHTNLRDDLPVVEADPGQMHQVIMNLIFNAAEAIGRQPGTVNISTDIQQVSEDDDHLWQYTGQPLSSGKYVTLTVQDTGIGMSAETLARIFDPFFTTKFTGRGLGLAVVLGIVRGHKAGMHVRSQLGRGTTFHLLFRASRKTLAVPPAVDTAAVSLPSIILVIDDEEPVRDAVTDILGSIDLQVLTASDGIAGIREFEQHRKEIQLIILDLSMPGLSGAETFHRLRTIDPDVPVILSSGYSAAEATRQFPGQTLIGFIQKPYNARTLIAEIRKHLEQVRRTN